MTHPVQAHSEELQPIFLMGGVHLYGSVCFFIFGLIYWFLIHSAYMFFSNCLFAGLCGANWLVYISIRKDGEKDVMMATVFLTIVYLGLLNIVIHLGIYDSPLIYWGLSVVVAAAFVYSIRGILVWVFLGLLFFPLTLFLKRTWFAHRAIPLDRFQTEFLNAASYVGILLFIGLMFYLFQKQLTGTLGNLVQSEQRLKRAQNIAHLGGWERDLTTNALILSDEMYRLMGLPPGDSRGTYGYFLSHIHPDDRNTVASLTAEAVKAAKSYVAEFRFVHDDGSTLHFHSTADLIMDKRGHPVGLVGTAQDITKQKQMGENVRASERKFRMLFEHSADPSLLLLGNAFVDCNKAALDILRAGSKEAVFNVHPSALSPEYQPDGRLSTEKADEMIAIAVHRGSHRFEWTHRRMNGEIFPVEVSLTLIQEAGHTMVFAVWRDITERKQAEAALLAAKRAAETATQSKAKFLDTAAHELRTPITVLSLLLQFVQKQIESGQPVSAATFARLREPADRLTHLVVDLLDVSRMERSLLVLRPARLDLNSIVSTCSEEFRLLHPSRHITFTKPAKPIVIDFDPVRINQVLSNLLDNAVKYTPAECPIEITIEPMPKTVRVSVIDHGPGIPKEQQTHLFDAFSRGSTEATVRASGLGLGLSVCRGIIELHAGTIGVLSEVGSGSTFYFELPLSRRDSA